MRFLAPLSVVVALLIGAPAQATTTGVVLTVGSTYVPGDTAGEPQIPLVHVAGGELSFTNLDVFNTHTVSEGFTWSTERLFDSGPVNPRQSAPVAGIAVLPPGRYRFFCKLHPAMTGAIDVVG